jgi:hypothetical protein
MLDKSIDYSNMLAEEQNKSIAHNDYLAEKMNQMIEHQDYIVEEVNKMGDNLVEEGFIVRDGDTFKRVKTEDTRLFGDGYSYKNVKAFETLSPEDKNFMYGLVNELGNGGAKLKFKNLVQENDPQATEIVNTVYGRISNGAARYVISIACDVVTAASGSNARALNSGVLDDLIADYNENYVNETTEGEGTTEPAANVEEEKFDAKTYRNELSERLDAILATAKAAYAEAKAAEEKALEESKKNVDTKNFTLINYLPERLNERWSKLSDERKQEILAEAKMFVINNQASAEYFWNTRDFRDKQIELKKVDEAAVAQPTAVNENVVSDERLQAMKEQIQRRMRKY